ncbi:MAG: ferredoxin--NADP reductase [Planctomycetota bacterium]
MTDLEKELNATVTRRWDITPVLAIFRVESDGDLFDFTAGQYCVLGLPPTFPRIPEAEPEEPRDPKKKERLIRRAYSIASSSRQREYLEFYVALVTSGALTPRLWALEPGDRIWVGPKATGLFTLDQVPEEAPLYLLATGTGLAPYMSMLGAELADPECTRPVVIAHGARYSSDLGYRAELEVYGRKNESFTYIPSITRPAEDPDWCGETGYVQAQVADGRLERLSGVPLDPTGTHVFLCGHPSMIEAATEILVVRGFTEWSKRENPEGTIHTEKYW